MKDNQDVMDVLKAIKKCLRQGFLGKSASIKRMVGILTTNYGMEIEDIECDIFIYIRENEIYDGWNRDCKLSTYFNTVIFYYLSNEVRKRQRYDENGEVVTNSSRTDAYDLPKSKMCSWVDDPHDVPEDAAEYSYSDLREWDFFKCRTPEDEYLYKESKVRLVKQYGFEEMDLLVLLDEVSIEDAAEYFGITYDGYRQRLYRLRKKVKGL